MPAGIVEGAQTAVAVAQNDDRIVADLDRQIVAGILHFAVVTHEQPIAVPNHVQIDLVVLRAAIEISFQGGFEITSPQSAQHGIARGHRCSARNPKPWGQGGSAAPYVESGVIRYQHSAESLAPKRPFLRD